MSCLLAESTCLDTRITTFCWLGILELYHFLGVDQLQYKECNAVVSGNLQISCAGFHVHSVSASTQCPLLGWFWSVDCVLTVRNMPLCNLWSKSTCAEPAEHIVWVFTGWGWWEVRRFSSFLYVLLNLPCITYGANKFLCNTEKKQWMPHHIERENLWNMENSLKKFVSTENHFLQVTIT